ncbi:MAG: divergent polysaccharide deacetylase family protein [Alphaproteobacteria bacterium]|nr:divergent polysaccharide deacetylase family protein [Alphaproteobacteria bacterium]
MPASRTAETSALRTGLNQLVLGCAVFGLLGAAGGGAAYLFGDPDAGSPKIEIALFQPQAGPPPVLKTRLENLSPDIATGALHGAESDEIPDGTGDGDEGDAPVQASFTVTEVDNPKTIAVSASTALPKAPIAGFYQRTPAGDLPKIADDGRTPAEAYARPFTPVAGAPKVSLIVSGLGLKASHTLAAINDLPPEVTLSFVPYANDLQTWINRARAAGHEVLLELPMEPYDYPNVDTGPYTLLTSASTDENIRRLNLLLGKASGYFGVTNYQGAKFATDTHAAGPVFDALKSHGLVFVNDGAAARSVLPDAAKTSGLSFHVADRIVDVETSADAIDHQLLQLEALALQNGDAIGIGYAYPVTIEQFRIWTQGLKAKGYQLAPVSASVGVHTAPAAPDGAAAQRSGAPIILTKTPKSPA